VGDGRLNNVVPGEPAVNERDLKSFLHGRRKSRRSPQKARGPALRVLCAKPQDISPNPMKKNGECSSTRLNLDIGKIRA